MGSVSVLSYICCMFVSRVHPVAILNAAFCKTCSLLMLVEDARCDHMDFWTDPAERRYCWPDGRISWLVDHKREDRTPPSKG